MSNKFNKFQNVKPYKKYFENRGALQISFAWLFAIIVGAVVLFLAIFWATRLLKTNQLESDVKTSKEIGVLLNNIEISFESAKSASLLLPVETKIFNQCDNSGYFGEQRIQTQQKSFNKWTETDTSVGFSNKYIFSDNPVQGKSFYLFSKPFNFPFKVADLIYLTSSEKTYCFKEAPEDIEDEITSLKQKNIFIENCSLDSIDVCFGSGDCDIYVNYAAEKVSKGSDTLYFEDNALMYAAIFSDKEIYECQVKRLMQRTNQLALLYRDKAALALQTSGCSSNLNLILLSNLANSLDSSANLNFIERIAEDIQDKNELNQECRLW